MPSLVCPKCNYQTKKNEVFCSKCGTKLEHIKEQKKSNSRGKELKPGDDSSAQSDSKPKTKKGLSCGLIISLSVIATIYGMNNRARQKALENMKRPHPNITPEQIQGMVRLRPYREKAEKGGAFSQYKLGEANEKGDGVQADMSEAIKWYRMAANQGNQNAKEALKRPGY